MSSVLLVSIFLVVVLAEVLAAPQIYTHLYRVPHASPAFGTHRIVHLGPFGPVIPNVYHLPSKAPAVSSLATSTVPSITTSTGRQGQNWPDSIFQTTSAPTISPPTTSTFPSTTTSTAPAVSSLATSTVPSITMSTEWRLGPYWPDSIFHTPSAPTVSPPTTSTFPSTTTSTAPAVSSLVTSTVPSITTSTNKIWTATVKACIAGHNNKEITGPSFEECKILCENETSFSCASVDYYPPENLCQLSTDDNGNEDYMEPCYSPYDDFNIYSQIIDDGGVVRIAGQYLTFSKENVSSWDQAVERCKALNARLAVLADPKAFQTYMYENYRGTWFYLGASDITIEGRWKWTDGKPLQRSFPWGPHQPDDYRGVNCPECIDGQDCLSWGYNDRFDDMACIYDMHYVCEHEINNTLIDSQEETAPVVATPTPRTECPSPWFRIADQCFLVVNDESDWLSWAAAQDHCKTLAPEANLAQPRDIKVLDGLVQYIFEINHQAAEGGDYNPTDSHYWLGGSDLTTEGEWLWVNNDTIPFTNSSGWYPGEPNGKEVENCLEMYPHYHAIISLNDDRCQKKQGFVCERH